MRSFYTLLLLTFIAFASHSYADDLNNLTLLTEDYPPYNYEKDGYVTGFSIELMDEMLKRAGSQLGRDDIELTTWARAYSKAKKQPHTLLFVMTKTKARQNLFKWIGPIGETIIGVTAPKSKNLKINSLDDLHALKIGVVNSDIGELLLNKADMPRRSIEAVANNTANVLKLAAGRIDAIAYESNVAFHTMRDLNIDPDLYEVVYILEKAQLYISASLKTPQSVIEKLQKALDSMKADGTFKSIAAKYFS